MNLKNNRIHNDCNFNCHNIFLKMTKSFIKNYYIGNLFTSCYYPKFNTYQKCVQYLQEYALLHFLQIEETIFNIFKYFKIKSKKIKILDIGSGPATLALTLNKMMIKYPKLKKYQFDITTVELSKGFCSMIDIFQKYNNNPKINIERNIALDMFELHKVCNIYFKNKSYDWIFMANCLAPIGERIKENYSYIKNSSFSYKLINYFLNRLIKNILSTTKQEEILLTLVEGNCTRKYFNNHFNMEDYFNFISFKDLRIKKKIKSIQIKCTNDTRKCIFFNSTKNISIHIKNLIAQIQNFRET